MSLDFRDTLWLDNHEYIVSNKILYNDKEYYYLSNANNKIKIVYKLDDEMFDVTNVAELKIVLEMMNYKARVLLEN
ncbi:MAG: hypothetical protein K2J20_02275 [Bacilli bacterium]|nr:hypothetical protein [Bacilli bacterium]